MRIPTSFKLINRSWSVVEMPQETADTANIHGCCARDQARIAIHIDEGLPEESVDHTYLHELVHALLYATTKPKLSDNEEFVDSLAAALHQYEQTKKGNLRG